MPIKRVGEGLFVVGFVAISAMIVVAFVSSRPDVSGVLITAVLGFASSTIGGVLAIIHTLDKVVEKQEEASAELANARTHTVDVKNSLAVADEKAEKRMEILQQTSDQIHVLVNDAMNKQLQLAAALSRRLATLTGDPADLAAAEQSESLYNAHQKKSG